MNLLDGSLGRDVQPVADTYYAIEDGLIYMQADTILRTYIVVLVVRRHAVDLKDGVLENRRETTELQAVNSAEIEILVSDANIDMVSSDDLGAFHQDGSEAVLAGNRNMLRCEGESYG